jgi:minor extracellular serine protease Vpr
MVQYTVPPNNSKLRLVKWDGSVHGPSEDISHGMTLYSSHGPTVDGRVKPDISAPGSEVVGPLSRIGADKDIMVWPDPNTNYGRYSFSGGTSLAAPIVTGIVALMLQVKPTLSPEEVKQILQQTSLTDEFTGSILTPNNYWGSGKVNALNAIQSLLGITENRVAIHSVNNDVKVNILPHSIKVTGGTSSDFPCEAAWYSINGKLIKKQFVNRDKTFNYPEAASSQVYILKLQIQKAVKTMLLKR